MSEPFIAEIKMVGFNFPPRGWAQCDGQLLPINQHQALYSLIGNLYGGDGMTTLGLPDLRGRTPVHEGPGFNLGQKGGEERHVLTQAEMASHDHALQGTTAVAGPTGTDPNGRMFASATHQAYGRRQDPVVLNDAIADAGSDQAHENRQPLQVVNFCIALQGLFPGP